MLYIYASTFKYFDEVDLAETTTASKPEIFYKFKMYLPSILKK